MSKGDYIGFMLYDIAAEVTVAGPGLFGAWWGEAGWDKIVKHECVDEYHVQPE